MLSLLDQAGQEAAGPAWGLFLRLEDLSSVLPLKKKKKKEEQAAVAQVLCHVSLCSPSAGSARLDPTRLSTEGRSGASSCMPGSRRVAVVVNFELWYPCLWSIPGLLPRLSPAISLGEPLLSLILRGETVWHLQEVFPADRIKRTAC